ncbi:hypothetical protein Afil01_44960 [Actinorhabdospora filicis]|uniref:DoxX family protein n=1 Tax=Actinorhabdospora filicis TaxID=1785913 RepID=A0A9W6SPL0_9ACTN|nr:DoxX family protein [Actinorhabdospora filicis]GLZ79689.1 hypothetical protein Afil01_44960 [Actinorhabdospora filicis]
MHIAFLIVAALTVLANGFEMVAGFARASFVRGNAALVGLAPKWIVPLAVLKGAGAAGVLLGLLGVPLIGEAAAIGLVLFFVGAMIAHVRARVFHNIAFPAAFLALAAGTLVLGLLD